MTDKELLALEGAIDFLEQSCGSEPWSFSKETVDYLAADLRRLKRRIEQPSEREKTIIDALKHYAEICGNGEGLIARQALAAYEKEEVK